MLVFKVTVLRVRANSVEYGYTRANSSGAKMQFLTLRQQTETMQGVLVLSKENDPHQVSKQMLNYAKAITVGLGLRTLADSSDRVHRRR